jgi:hypothetical protein
MFLIAALIGFIGFVLLSLALVAAIANARLGTRNCLLGT